MIPLQNSWQAEFETRYRFIASEDLEKHLRSDTKLVVPAQRWGLDYVVLSILGVHPTTDLSQYRIMSRVALREVFTSMMLRRGFVLNPVLRRGLRRLIEAGLWSHWTERISDQYRDRKELMVEKDSRVLLQPEHLNLSKLRSIFVMLLIGLGLSGLAFSGEMCVFGFLKKKKIWKRKRFTSEKRKNKCCKCQTSFNPNIGKSNRVPYFN